MADALSSLFVQDAERLTGNLDMVGRNQGKMSKLIEKNWIPDGAGFNWQSVQVQRTIPNSAQTWTAVQANNGTNSCVPTPSVVDSATQVQDYSAYVTALESEEICLNDARYGYNFKEQVTMKRENFANNIFDVWDDRDRYQYTLLSKWKYVADDGLSYTENATTFPFVEPTNYATMNLLRAFYIKLIQDGADVAHGAYATRNGQPIFMAIMDSETMANIIETDTGTRQDINYSYMGSKEKNPLLEAWGIERDYGGFFMTADNKMPRYDFVGGVWVERPYYVNDPTTVGNAAQVNPEYVNAEYTDIIFFNKQVVTREMPRPMSSVGADTNFMAMNYNGTIQWLNIQEKVRNPIKSIGNWYAILQAAYRPRLTNYGFVLRVARCTSRLYHFGSCSG